MGRHRVDALDLCSSIQSQEMTSRKSRITPNLTRQR